MKCFKCKSEGEKDSMICIEKRTGKLNKNGTEKKIRKYFHLKCYEEFKQEQILIERDLKELDELYQYLLELHSFELLDGRMMEKIQDLRNGSIKVGGKKIKKYKQGVTYSLMLETYKYLGNTIDHILRNMQFQTDWNAFSYIFGTMIKNINTIKEIEKQSEKTNTKPKSNQESLDIKVRNNVKKDELDISAFL